MLNHVRTLLLNQSQQPYSPEYDFAEEIVPPEFRRRSLTGLAAILHSGLFGSSPDRLFCNLRLRQLLTLLHASSLANYLTAADARITYTLEPYQLPAHELPADIPLTSGPVANSQHGWCDFSYQLSWHSSAVTVLQTLPRPRTQHMSLTMTDGLSGLIPLGDSSATCRVRGSGEAAIHIRAPLGEELPQLSADLSQRYGDQFMAAGAVSQYRQVWDNNPTSPDKYAALLLQLVTHISQQPEVRT